MITRWLRVYEQEPKAAQSFAERLRKGYTAGERTVTQSSRYETMSSKEVGRSVMTPDGTRFITHDIDENELVIEMVASGAEVRRIPLAGAAELEVTSNIVIDGEGEYI